MPEPVRRPPMVSLAVAKLAVQREQQLQNSRAILRAANVPDATADSVVTPPKLQSDYFTGYVASITRGPKTETYPESTSVWLIGAWTSEGNNPNIVFSTAGIYFPPNDPTCLSEFRRAQSSPHLMISGLFDVQEGTGLCKIIYMNVDVDYYAPSPPKCAPPFDLRIVEERKDNKLYPSNSSPTWNVG